MNIFTVKINCEGDIFKIDERAEISRILRNIADRVDAGDSIDTFRNVTDINGNICGQFALKPDTYK